jgi:succinoglycan biosynthesis transport protein ExoP
LAAVVAALCAGIACAYLRVTYSSEVQSAGEVKREVHGAFLGYLPLQRRQSWEALEQSPAQLESVRMVRTALLNRLNTAKGNVVQITSAGVGTGKTTLAVLLGRSLAQCGKSVLLVDADARRPRLAQRFGIPQTPGFNDALVVQQQEFVGIRATATPGLYVLPGGISGDHNELEPLANGAFSALLDQWREAYDIVLFDSAPLLAMADTGILSSYADGTVLVVRERHCRRDAVVGALAFLGAAGGRLLGTVFVGSGSGGAYGYYYAHEGESATKAPDE